MSKKSGTQIALYKSVVGLEDVGPFTSFRSAVADFCSRIKAMPYKSYQMIETACWIERSCQHYTAPLYFYNVRDFSIKTGILTQRGEVIEPSDEPGEDLINKVYVAAIQNDGDAQEFIAAMAA